MPVQVFVLSRMGSSLQALELIIGTQQDVPAAIEFVRLQQDDELWDSLIDWALKRPDTTGGWGVVGGGARAAGARGGASNTDDTRGMSLRWLGARAVFVHGVGCLFTCWRATDGTGH